MGIGLWLLSVLVAGASALPGQGNGDSEILKSYLAASRSSADANAAVMAIVRDAQMIRLQYDQNVPTKSPIDDATFASSLRASSVTPLSRHVGDLAYSGITVAFSRSRWDAEDVKPDQWLHEMRRPILTGYVLTSISIVRMPTPATKKASFDMTQKVRMALLRAMERTKPDFAQLSDFNSVSFRLGTWRKDGWSDFGFLRYEHAVGPARKEGREKLSTDWCALWFALEPIGSGGSQAPSHARQYPLQGIQARWTASSGSDKLNTMFSQIVLDSLRELDALEESLVDKAGQTQQQVRADANKASNFVPGQR
jgi:hypothetical protein